MIMMKSIKLLALASLACFLLISCENGSQSAVATDKASGANAKSPSKTAPIKTVTSSKKATTSAPIEGGMEWLSFDQVDQLGNKENKKYLVDVYTSWCGWCKVMDKQTFTNDEVKSYVGDKFHPVKFDAEQKDPIKFKGQDYEWMPGGRKGINKLAVELLGGRMSYPSLVYLDEQMNKIRVSPGFKKPEQLLAELKSLETM